MFILLINYVVMSYRRCKGTAVLGDSQISGGLSPEVVATGAAICDKALTRRQNRVAKLSHKKEKRAVRPAFYFCRYDNRRLEEEVAVVNHS